MNQSYLSIPSYAPEFLLFKEKCFNLVLFPEKYANVLVNNIKQIVPDNGVESKNSPYFVSLLIPNIYFCATKG